MSRGEREETFFSQNAVCLDVCLDVCLLGGSGGWDCWDCSWLAVALDPQTRLSLFCTPPSHTFSLSHNHTTHSAVLLIDTASPMWTVLHASTGWQHLMQQIQQQQQHQPSPAMFLGGYGSDSSSGGSYSSSLSGGDDSNNSCRSSISSESVIGQSLWALVDAASLRSRCPGGVTAKQQVCAGSLRKFAVVFVSMCV